MGVFAATLAGVSAGAVLLLAWVAIVHRRRADAVHIPEGSNPSVLLRDGVVIDSNCHARDFFGSALEPGTEWAELREHISQEFQNVPAQLPNQAEVYSGPGKTGARLVVDHRNNMHIVSITLSDAMRDAIGKRDKSTRYKDVIDHAPHPIWETDTDETVIWRNKAYEILAETCAPPNEHLSIFEMPPHKSLGVRHVRASLKCASGETQWYEIASERIGERTIHYAKDIGDLVMAEMAQRNFVQTLTKTFAHLPIGLSVFDRDHRLVLFNPALVDLTRLPVDFLSARPNLLSFFDHMRENRMMPEPKSYSIWRDQLADVVAAAQDDRYCETWSLPSGLTYKITGRPHPDGAIAFLLEDISAEISLTRRFRSELELTQSVIDSFGDAVAVFSQTGVLTFCNTAYRALWSCEPDSAFAEMTIVDATQAWQQACEPSPVWAEIREFVVALRDRASWDADLTLRDGGQLQCLIEPIAAGSTLIRFAKVQSEQHREALSLDVAQ